MNGRLHLTASDCISLPRISLANNAASFAAAVIFSVVVTGMGSGGLGGSITGMGFS